MTKTYLTRSEICRMAGIDYRKFQTLGLTPAAKLGLFEDASDLFDVSDPALGKALLNHASEVTAQSKAVEALKKAFSEPCSI